MVANCPEAAEWLSEHQESIQRAVSRCIARRPDVLTRHTRDDLVQESYAAACAAFATWLPSSKTTLERYVFGSVKFALLRYSSQAKREFATPEDVVAEDAETACDHPILAKLLRRLGKEERQFIVLRYGLHGSRPHTERELASKYGRCQKTIQERQQRIECMLSRMAKDSPPQPEP